MRGLDTLTATFVQIAPDGAFTTGRLWIQRPGQMRMQYDPPADILLVTTDWRLVFYDAKVAACRFYCREVLPNVTLARKLVEASSLELMDLPEEAF